MIDAVSASKNRDNIDLNKPIWYQKKISISQI